VVGEVTGNEGVTIAHRSSLAQGVDQENFEKVSGQLVCVLTNQKSALYAPSGEHFAPLGEHGGGEITRQDPI
jgi:hypothetical protein